MSISGNLSYGTAEIQVEPDQLLNAANQVQSKVKMMQQSFETIKTNIKEPTIMSCLLGFKEYSIYYLSFFGSIP